MNFSALIDSIMSDVNGGSTEPFLIYRDKDGEWRREYTRNQNDETHKRVEKAKARDPLAVMCTGREFSQGSFASVYDDVLCKRIRAEYNDTVLSGAASDADCEKFYHLANFFIENSVMFSPGAADYLTSLERPLAALAETRPFRAEPDSEEWFRDKDSKRDAIKYIESAISERRRAFPDEFAPEKRDLEEYAEKLRLRLGGKCIVLSEKATEAGDLYLVRDITRDNQAGVEEDHNKMFTDDYLLALREFTNRVDKAAERLRLERYETRLPYRRMTAADCWPDGKGVPWEGRVIIVKPEALAPEYRSAEHQLVLCTGGFGANTNARGGDVFARELHSGKESRYERHQIAGLAAYGKMPAWAVKKLALVESAKEPPPKTKETGAKKPSLSDRLDKAKAEAAARSAKRGDIPRTMKRESKEVG